MNVGEKKPVWLSNIASCRIPPGLFQIVMRRERKGNLPTCYSKSLKINTKSRNRKRKVEPPLREHRGSVNQDKNISSDFRSRTGPEEDPPWTRGVKIHSASVTEGLDGSRSSVILRSVCDASSWTRAGSAATLVQTVALSAEQNEPVDLRRQDARVSQVGVQRQVEGHAVERDAVVLTIRPVHVREECNAAREEGEQHHAAVGFVQPAILKAELVEIKRKVKKGELRALKHTTREMMY